jgi:hypothetical protein
MPTENRRVATYLPANVDQRLEAFKDERGIRSDSQALVVILSEFLGVSQEVALLSSLPIGDLVRHEFLEERLAGLKSELLSELDSRLKGFESLIEQRFNDLKEQADSNQENKIGTKYRLLGELLKSSEPQAAQQIPQMDKVKEIEGGSLPGDTLVGLPKDEDSNNQLTSSIQDELPIITRRKRGRPRTSEAMDGTLSTAELARRLEGMSSSSLSHWKPGGQREKSAEALLKATREKDPDGIGWIYLPGANRFRPEIELPSSSPTILQSELLGNSMPEDLK